jgi:hypothetical protein
MLIDQLGTECGLQPITHEESDMKQRHLLVLTVLGGIFLVLVVLLVLTALNGDNTNHKGSTLPAVTATR